MELTRGRSRFFVWISLCVLISFAYFISAALEAREIHAQFRSRVGQWELEIAQALIAKDWISLSRRLEYLNGGNLDGVELKTEGSTIFASPVDFDSTECLINWSAPLERYKSELGQLAVCPDLALIARSTLYSPLFILLALGSILIMLASSVVVLRRYRSGVVSLIEHLSRTDLDHATLAKSIEQTETDPVTAKVWILIRQALDARAAKEKAQSEADASNRLGMLAARVAHDIRSPLSALKIALALDPSNRSVRELLLKATDRIHDISSQLLDEARGKLRVVEIQEEITVKSVILKRDIIDALIAESQVRASSQNSIFEVDVGAIENLRMNCNASEIQRSISNLISNAFEAAGPGGTIKLAATADEDYLNIEISDNGPGIPREVMAKIGTLGFTHGKGDSTGMGVYFAKKEIESCGGKLVIRSDVLVGTTVSLVFPRPTGEADQCQIAHSLH